MVAFVSCSSESAVAARVSLVICVPHNLTPVAKEPLWTLTSHHVHKLAPNGRKDLNVRTKTIKLPGENLGKNLHDIGFDSDFLDVTPKPQAVKEKNRYARLHQD